MSEVKKKIIIKDIVDTQTSKGKKFHKIIDKYDNEFSVWDNDLAAKLLSVKGSCVEILHTDDSWKTINSFSELSSGSKNKQGDKTENSSETQTSIESQCALKAAVVLVSGFKDLLYEDPKDFKWNDIVDLVCNTQLKLLKTISSNKNPNDYDIHYVLEEEFFPEENKKSGGKRF